MKLPTQIVTLAGKTLRVTTEIEVVSAIVIPPVPPIVPPPVGVGYTAKSGRLFDSAGRELQLRGISHFGFNADILQPQCLWAMGWKSLPGPPPVVGQLEQIKSLGFNAIRVPFTPDTLYAPTRGYADLRLNPGLPATPLAFLDLFMAECDRLGLYILLDFHSVTNKGLHPAWFTNDPSLTYNAQPYTKADWIRDLVFVAKRYAGLSKFMGLDLYNEPNGKVRWDAGDANMTDAAYFWKPAAEQASAAVLAANPKVLIFVQGTEANWDGKEKGGIPINWGENFQPQAYNPLKIPADKLVLSPHSYGPDVYMEADFNAPTFPTNLSANWETLFGQLYPKHPVIVGEWGGRYGQGGVGLKDKQWQDAFVDYLLSKGIRSSFYWCYTPNSGDTGGVLSDDLTVREDKMALLRRHWG